MGTRDLESRLTQTGQVTIPAAIRARLGPRPKDRVRVDGDDVKHRLASSKLRAGFGEVASHRRPEDWPAVEDAVEQLMAVDVAEEN